VNQVDQAAGRSTTPWGILPVMTIRHNPMRSLRASATTIFVLRALVSTLARYRCTSALSLLEQEKPPRELDQAAAHAGIAGFSQSWTCGEKVKRHLLSLTPVFRTGLG
jgi:hypothetical protein